MGERFYQPLFQCYCVLKAEEAKESRIRKTMATFVWAGKLI